MKTQKLLLALCIISIFICSCGDDGSDCETTVWYEDMDGDGLGNPGSTKEGCLQPMGYVADATDDFDMLIGDEQRAVIAYAGATWCPPCGEWGGPLFDFIDANFGSSKAVVLSFQIADKISPSSTAASEYGRDLQDVANTNSLPRIYVGGPFYYDQRGLYTSHMTNQNMLSTEINAIESAGVAVGINGSAKMVDDQIEVNAGVKFINGDNNEYFISTYLLEDGVIADQKVGSTSNSSTEQDVVHNHIVRENMDSAVSFKGKSLGNTFSQGEVVSERFTISIPILPASVPAINSENLKVALVVWKANGVGMSNGIVIDIN